MPGSGRSVLSGYCGVFGRSWTRFASLWANIDQDLLARRNYPDKTAGQARVLRNETRIGAKADGVVWAVGWQGAQDAKRSERPRPVSAGAAARNHARTYDMKILTLTVSPSALTLLLCALTSGARCPVPDAGQDVGLTAGEMIGTVIRRVHPGLFGWDPRRGTRRGIGFLENGLWCGTETPFSLKPMPRWNRRHHPRYAKRAKRQAGGHAGLAGWHH